MTPPVRTIGFQTSLNYFPPPQHGRWPTQAFPLAYAGSSTAGQSLPSHFGPPPKIPNLVVDSITNPPATPYNKGLLSDEEVAPVSLGGMPKRLLDDAKRADLALPSAPDQQFLCYHLKW